MSTAALHLKIDTDMYYTNVQSLTIDLSKLQDTKKLTTQKLLDVKKYVGDNTDFAPGLLS